MEFTPYSSNVNPIHLVDIYKKLEEYLGEREKEKNTTMEREARLKEENSKRVAEISRVIDEMSSTKQYSSLTPYEIGKIAVQIYEASIRKLGQKAD